MAGARRGTSEVVGSARAFPFPSRAYEGQSMVILEAMAAGLPIWPRTGSPFGRQFGGKILDG